MGTKGHLKLEASNSSSSSGWDGAGVETWAAARGQHGRVDNWKEGGGQGLLGKAVQGMHQAQVQLCISCQAQVEQVEQGGPLGLTRGRLLCVACSNNKHIDVAMSATTRACTSRVGVSHNLVNCSSVKKPKKTISSATWVNTAIRIS